MFHPNCKRDWGEGLTGAYPGVRLYAKTSTSFSQKKKKNETTKKKKKKESGERGQRLNLVTLEIIVNNIAYRSIGQQALLLYVDQ